jgi:hypothetical protein
MSKCLSIFTILMLIAGRSLAKSPITTIDHKCPDRVVKNRIIKEMGEAAPPKVIQLGKATLSDIHDDWMNLPHRVVLEVLINESGYVECVQLFRLDGEYHSEVIYRLISSAYQTIYEVTCDESGSPVACYNMIAINLEPKN